MSTQCHVNYAVYTNEDCSKVSLPLRNVQHSLNQNAQRVSSLYSLYASVDVFSLKPVVLALYILVCVQAVVFEWRLLPVMQPSAKMVQAAKNTVPHVENQSASLQLANMSRLTTIAISNLKNAVDRVSG